MSSRSFSMRPGVIRSAAALCVAGLLWGCASAERSTCAVRGERGVASALTNGTATPEYLKLDPSQHDAVVAILSGGVLACSGVLISEQLVVTASHCMDEETPEVLGVAFGRGRDALVFETSARIVARHSDRDVLVLALDESPIAAIGVEPLPVVSMPGALAPRSLVQLGGFGLDAATALEREFLVARIESIRDDRVVVSADGIGGACFGDSGGPLLVRGEDGRAGTLGVLDAGSRSCSGIDVYTRLDVLVDWLPEDPATTSAPVERRYESLGGEGRCFDRTAVWNEDGALRADVCDAGRACGWSERDRGYRCVDVTDDPCGGVTDLGVCDDGTAVRCVRGRLERNECSRCDFTCSRSPKTGRAICLAPGSADSGR